MLKKLWILFLFPILVNAQLFSPAKWSSSVKEVGQNEFEIEITGKIDKGWHLYSVKHPDGGIGIPASATFKSPADAKLVGGVREVGNRIDKYSKIFEQDEKYFENQVKFVQKVKVSGDKPVNVSYTIEFQMCDAERCLPPDETSGTVKLTPKAIVEDKKEEAKTEDKLLADSVIVPVATVDSSVSTVDSIASTNDTIKKVDDSLLADNEKKDNGLLKIFSLGFLGGLAALLMPCIFPMIPLTVSMFTKQSKSKGEGVGKAFIYGLSIIVIYVLLGLLATVLFGPSVLNEMSTNPWVNLAFFVVFIIFAVSFFGAFELTLPSKWVNAADKGADKGGLIGIFFMAFTLALVSFSCTGPIIGSLLVQATQGGNYYSLMIGMFGFSLALAIPFTLFAMFPGWLNSMPKSGGWLNTIKVSLGFIELAFALKFLSNADLVWQMNWLPREIFLSFWIAIFFLLGLYLLGKFRLELDAPTQTIGVPRLFFSLFAFVFVVYMIPGLWGAPLKYLSGLTPPMTYSESPRGFHEGVGSGQTAAKFEDPNMVEGPHGIPAFKDFELAAAYAEKVGKPMLLDFTGHACANCRKVEERVWSDERVKKILAEDVVLVSLYVDEAKELPEDQKVYSKALDRKLKTVGNKWTAFEIEHFNANAQPYYILVDKDLNRFSKPLEAELDIEVYLKWLNDGLAKYKAK
ncbi:Thiol:disulfide interchange protein DsbD precursor [Algoriella xinjiangensis]|uniref:protein-disulfide reductase DsbD family protein n=1 Tax=Algoriella xinjiangensis TaxID=684065 RepID=UPI000F62D15B|nr:cytochrome c biogenesis protein CcdA [Algoriella xinjiangensis]VDH15990.1 Thiol:disulfide interchange protein DsbD precursor [Algoriella xinjiangensis]